MTKSFGGALSFPASRRTLSEAFDEHLINLATGNWILLYLAFLEMRHILFLYGIVPASSLQPLFTASFNFLELRVLIPLKTAARTPQSKETSFLSTNVVFTAHRETSPTTSFAASWRDSLAASRIQPSEKRKSYELKKCTRQTCLFCTDHSKDMSRGHFLARKFEGGELQVSCPYDCSWLQRKMLCCFAYFDA